MKSGFAIPGVVMALASFAPMSAGAATPITIPGTANPFLAGATAGNYITYGPNVDANTDYATANSPVSIGVLAGSTLTISNVVDNGVGNCPGCIGPGGGTGVNSFTANGFTELLSSYSNLQLNSLVGAFNGPNGGTLFEIGSGGSFLVPTGASQFYLGTVDAYQWNNNVGNFTASIGGAVPEPATWALFIMGFGGIGAAMRFTRNGKKNGAPSFS
jgi:PEP-CTERM motif